MWELWAELSNYGRNAAQFVDLLGYVALKAPYSMQKVRMDLMSPVENWSGG